MLYLLIILFPLTMAASTFVLRKRRELILFVALATVLTQILLATQIPLDDPTRFLGVTLTLSGLNRLFIVTFLVVSGFAVIGAWHLAHGENFVPIALTTLAIVSAILLIQDPFLTALLLALTGLTSVLVIVDLPAGAGTLVGTKAIATALKYLILMVFACVLMYIAFVLTDIFRPGELPGRISLARFILALLAISFALRLALVPFHTWLTDLVDYTEPLVAMIVITLLNATSLLVLVLVFQSYPTLLIDSDTALGAMRLGAIVSALIGAGMAFAPASLRRTLAYLILYDCGMLFYGLTSLSQLGLAGAVFGALNQTLAVTLIFVSLGLLERPDGRPPGQPRRDLLRRWPIAGVGLLGGSLALLGVPPLNGSISRILIYQAAADYGLLELLALLAASGLAGLALVRAAHTYLIGPSDDTPAVEPLLIGETEFDREAPRALAPEPRSTAVLTLTLLLVCLGLGMYPEPVLATIEEAIRGLAFVRSP
jgi:formate hydrogenlyase subunit 3/multisubunit Na+/H+ antiporter MnhD subunit